MLLVAGLKMAVRLQYDDNFRRIGAKPCVKKRNPASILKSFK